MQFDWRLVGMGVATYENQTASDTNTYSVATVVALDPYTGQLKSAYTSNPQGPTIARFVVPSGQYQGKVSPLPIEPVNMLYHPLFGVMVYGPITRGNTTVAPTFSRNLNADPSNMPLNIQQATGNLQTNYGKFMPDIAGVSFGNFA
jgi:hypothetical protein